MIVVIFVFLYILINNIIDNNRRLYMSNAIRDFLNNETETDFFDEKDKEYINYAKKNNVNKYDITDFINNYIDIVNRSVKAKIDGADNCNGFYYTSYNPKDVSYIYYEKTTDKYRDIYIHGLEPNIAKYIIKNVTNKDIIDYNSGTFNKKIIIQLNKVFKFNNNNWFIESDDDLHIELPYNVYINYVSDKKKIINEIKEFLEVEILKGEIKKIKEKKPTINVRYKFETIDGKIINGETILGVQYNDSSDIKFNANYFAHLYCTLGNHAEIKTGQHDYDDAERKEVGELDVLTAERAKLGLEQTPQMNWDDYDEDGNYIGADETVSKEEAEEIIKYLSEHGITGIKSYDIKRPMDTKIEESNNIEDDPNLKIQAEMMEEFKRKAREMYEATKSVKENE